MSEDSPSPSKTPTAMTKGISIRSTLHLLRVSCYDIVFFKSNTYIMNLYPWYSLQSRTNSERSSGRNGDKKTNGKRNTIPKRLDILLSNCHGLIDN